MNNTKLLFALGSVAIAWYFVCILYIGLAAAPSLEGRGQLDGARIAGGPTTSSAPPTNLYDFMRYSITTLASTLATFVGMVLGLRQANAKAAAQGVAAIQATALTTAQWCAFWSYIASLVIGLALWWYRGTSCDPTIVHLGQSLLGVLGGALAVLLNVQ